jgi:hypothetical protein
MTPSKQLQKERESLQKRDMLLAKAGISPEWRYKTLRKAYQRLDEALDATKLVGESEVVDNQARLRAIEQVVDFEGVSVGKANEGGSHGPTTINLNLSHWMQPTTGSGVPQVMEGDPPKLLE